MVNIQNLSVLLCLCLTVTLSACGGDDRPVDGPGTTISQDGSSTDGAIVDSGSSAIDAGSFEDTALLLDTASADTGSEDDTWIWQDTASQPDTNVLPAEPVALTIVPPQATLPVGGQIALAVTAKLDDGSSIPFGASVQWESSAVGVVQVNNDGVASALSAGTATITAQYLAITAKATLTVTPLAVTGLTLTPPVASIGIGATQKFSAIATLDGGSTKDITESAKWTVDNPAVAEVSAAGEVIAKASGSTTVRAASGDKEATAELTVKAASIVSLTLTPAAPQLSVGESVNMKLTASYDDNSVADVTAAASWKSSDTKVAKVELYNPGVVTAVGPGGANISASFGALSASRLVTVIAKPKKLTAIEISPDKTNAVVGDSIKLTAEGFYDDGSKADLTTTVVWSSASAAIATVSNDPKSAGTVTTTGAGVATITAAYDGQSTTATITITDAKLTKLEITAASGTVPAGLTSQVKAFGTFSDGKKIDVTTQAIWS
ncbi:MAG TPA: hypothetical protein DCQ06_04770, partial [Myxococcales bacterium]|nr:hypothetical protein [Myxococcales bacterium]